MQVGVQGTFVCGFKPLVKKKTDAGLTRSTLASVHDRGSVERSNDDLHPAVSGTSGGGGIGCHGFIISAPCNHDPAGTCPVGDKLARDSQCAFLAEFEIVCGCPLHQ